MRQKYFFALSLATLLAGCAQFPFPIKTDDKQPAPVPAEKKVDPEAAAHTRYQHGLAKYQASNFDSALADLDAAVDSGRLKPAEIINARKHMAFIHCLSKRELQCREQFRTILKADPKFDLPPNEASHPLWEPVWRSVKGAVEEQRAVKRASSEQATPAQQKLADGVKDYQAGRYREALASLKAALKGGLPDKENQLRAHKYSAFIYCLSRRTTLCRATFRRIFAIDPEFELLPSEAGHPSWAAIYRSQKQATVRRSGKK